MPFMQVFFISIAVVILFVILLETARMLWHARKASRLGKQASPFSRPHTHARMHILVVGDSTAVGVGASHGRHSFAGQLAEDFPYAAIWNIAENAMNVKGLVRALGVIRHMTFDAVIIQIGGMDVLRLTSRTVLERYLSSLVHLLKEICTGPIVFVSMNNTGTLPAFRYSLLGALYTRRARHLRDFFERFSSVHGAAHVSLFDEKKDDPLLKDPCRFFARDGLHPSDDGYRLMYHQKLRDHLQVLLTDRS